MFAFRERHDRTTFSRDMVGTATTPRKKKFVNNYGTSQEQGKDTKVLEKVMIIIVRNSNNKGRLTSFRKLSERLRVDVSFVRKWNHDER